MMETTFIGVFDGHGGKSAATFARNFLPFNILMSDRYSVDPVGAIKEGFLKTDR